MYNYINNYLIRRIVPLKNNYSNVYYSYRMISTNEIATVLRPFYFVVHPDLFGRFPVQRAINEDSIKQLGVYLESIQHRLPSSIFPSKLPFYVRDADADSGTFKLVNVPLERNNDTEIVLKKILEACNLSTDYLDKVKSNIKPKKILKENIKGYANQYRGNMESFDEDIIFEKVNFVKGDQKLSSWFKANLEVAMSRTEALKGMKGEISKLEENIKNRLKIKELRYDCGWNVEHYRGCLKSLETLTNLHEDLKSLEGRIVVFAQFTGVSLDGHIMLFTGDVHKSWLDLLRNLPKHDAHLKKIPAYEHTLSQILRNIRIKRRKFMPKTHASEYTAHLRQIMTTLLDFLSKHSFPKLWPESLANFEIVIESEAGPLMVSPTGQIIVPSTCPGFLLIDFITNHLEEAQKNATEYKKNKYVEKSLHDETKQKLKLASLQKDDSVTPELMIKCLERLASSNLCFDNINLHITHYYSVLADGTVCIPWDWRI